MLKHHVFLVRNWEKIWQKQDEAKPSSAGVRSAALCTRWAGVGRDDGNIKSGEGRGRVLPSRPCRAGASTPSSQLLPPLSLESFSLDVKS